MSLVTFNIGGVRFQILLSTLAEYPQSTLFELASERTPLAPFSTQQQQQQQQHSDIFLDHNPLAFMCVLDFMRYHRVLVPRNVCREVVLLQLNLFKIPIKDNSAISDGDTDGMQLSELSRNQGLLLPLSATSASASQSSDLPPPSYTHLFGSQSSLTPPLGSLKPASSPLLGALPLQSTTHGTQMSRINAFVSNVLIPKISEHAQKGHTRLRLLLLPSTVDPSTIANDILTSDSTSITDFITPIKPQTSLLPASTSTSTSMSYSLPQPLQSAFLTDSDISFLMQQDVCKHTITTLKNISGIAMGSYELCHITLRTQTEFGLFESRSLEILAYHVKVC